MPKHRNKQHWNDRNPGFQINNRQSAKNNQRNMMGQDSCTANCNQKNFPSNASNYSDNLDVQNDYFQNDSKNFCDPSLQRDLTQNHDQSNINQNFQTDIIHNASNTELKPNFQRNGTESSSSNINYTIDQSDLIQHASIKNVKKKPNTIHTWYEWYRQQAKPPKQTPKRDSKADIAVKNYNKLTKNFYGKGYIIRETLYKDPDLFYASCNGNTDPSSNNEANDNWTDTFWQKHNDSSVLEDSRTSQTTGKVSKKNQNRLERTLNDMLSKPTEMSKGNSLLQKMGWRGGGLGRDEEGITKPIAPKATYVVNTIGLSHLTGKLRKPMLFANITDKQLRTLEFRTNFVTNVLLYILKFVKNDEKKIVFEPRLYRKERDGIHQIVEKIRVSDNVADFDHIGEIKFSDKHLELVTDIWEHNCYELRTEDEGVRQNRQICIFKEAPAHVYLVTPENLKENGESNDKNENDNETDDNIKTEKVKVSDTTTNYKEKCDRNQYLNVDFKNRCNDIKKEISETVESQLDVNMDKNSQNLVKNEPNTPAKTQKTGNICKKIIPKTEINKQIIVISDGSDSEDEMATNINENISNTATNINIIQQDQKDTKESVLAKIVKYFKEFSSDETFKEFRFLGPFDCEKIRHINVFFDICMKQDDAECDEKYELLAAYDNDSVIFDVLEDNNGTRFIKKVEDTPELPSEDEEVIYASGAYI